MTIRSLKEFQEFANEERFRGMQRYSPYFRGELSDDTFILKPNLTRSTSNVKEAIELEKSYFEKVKSEWSTNSDYIQIPNPKGYENDWMLLFQAQHLSIPTRFMDWSLRPEVALFFAVFDKSNKHIESDGRIWVLRENNPIEISDEDFFVRNSPFELKATVFMNPPFYLYNETGAFNRAQANRLRQHGKFLVQSIEDSLRPLNEILLPPVLEKYIIPKEFKQQILKELHEFNYTEESLFPTH